MPQLDRDAAREWIRRWDRQQEDHLPDREDRFNALIDAVEDGAGRPDPLVIDLGCGPGSLSVRLLDRIPAATIAAADADPVMLALARAAFGDRAGVRFTSVDLRSPGWSDQLRLERPADAAVSTTALHWLRPQALAVMYAELAKVLRPGGLLLNGDHFKLDESQSPVLARLDEAMIAREERRRFPNGHSESWHGWWDAVVADPALAGAVAEREAWRDLADHHGTGSGLLRTHLEALRNAGFAEAGTLWQRGENRLLCAVRGA
jgi:SAM-dependent methyltransferase